MTYLGRLHKKRGNSKVRFVFHLFLSYTKSEGKKRGSDLLP